MGLEVGIEFLFILFQFTASREEFRVETNKLASFVQIGNTVML